MNRLQEVGHGNRDAKHAGYQTIEEQPGLDDAVVERRRPSVVFWFLRAHKKNGLPREKRPVISELAFLSGFCPKSLVPQ
jgi:hypothetical protein